MEYDQDALLRKLIEIRYERNDIAFDPEYVPGPGRQRGDLPCFAKDHAIRVEFWGTRWTESARSTWSPAPPPGF